MQLKGFTLILLSTMLTMSCHKANTDNHIKEKEKQETETNKEVPNKDKEKNRDNDSAAENENIVNTTAGNLKQAISSKYTGRNINKLIIKGDINGDDINYLRTEIQGLQTLNLSKARIVKGGSYSLQLKNAGQKELQEKGINFEAIATKNNSISTGMFFNMSSLIELSLPDNTESIEYIAFSQCENLQRINIPNSVINIEAEAFSRCNNLTEVKLPNSLKSISNSLFRDCSKLNNIVIPKSVTSIGESAFAHCSSLKSIELSDGITRIEEGAFAYTGISSMTLPNSLTVISAGLFTDCKNLENIVLPNSIKSIENSAFEECSSINEIRLPETISNIGARAFRNCTKLTSIHCYPINPFPIGILCFEGISENCKLYVNKDSIEKYNKKEGNWAETNFTILSL